jgi:SAM-dependent methyltransferase
LCIGQARYAGARLYFHPLVMKQIVSATGVERFGRALDVACGTGQSSRALVEIANRVDAIDVSAEMLAEAIITPHEGIRYELAAAERLPFQDAAIDLITVGLAFHWFDQAGFLREARRVLAPSGWLVIYSDGFMGEMAEDAAFREWAWEIYPKKFPTPPRRSVGVSQELVKPSGFEVRGNEPFRHDERMSADELSAYLLTQTNVIAAVESGAMPIEEAARWIRNGVEPFFRGEKRTMRFSGSTHFVSGHS